MSVNVRLPRPQSLPRARVWSSLGIRLAYLLMLTGLVLLLSAVQARLPLQPDTVVETASVHCAHGDKAGKGQADTARLCEAGSLIDIEDFDPPLISLPTGPAQLAPHAWPDARQVSVPPHPRTPPLRPPRLRA